QEEVKLNGWAIECRVYAEDPFRNFLPSTGRMVYYRPPEETENVRVDTGVYEGGEVSMFYDPMIAKLVAYGANRDIATTHMGEALDQYCIRGVSHNISFLNALMAHPRFKEGRLSTDFIAEEYPDGFHAADVPHENPALFIAVAASIHRLYMDRAAHLSGQLPGHERSVGEKWVVVSHNGNHEVTVNPVDGGYRVEYATESYQVISDWRLGEPLFKCTINGAPVCVQYERHELWFRLFHRGSRMDTLVITPRVARLNRHMLEKAPPDLSRYLLSPMPGLLVKLSVAEGDEVKAGEELAVVEAMKMENVLRASQDVSVVKLLVEQGDSLAVDQKIMEFA
ncbi:MAG: acetyl/propionyl-CoA carboxylase subunit alpha, partial [Gammaproteobacteria bacterium]|nr:acetyl/propionyl-CoA carboxylase subunit alpha [Gammaproteobacteria bacterium]